MPLNATLYTSPFFQKNQRFNLSNNATNLNGDAYPYHILKKQLLEHGVVLNTQDITPIYRKTAFVLYQDMPILSDIRLNNLNYLILLESELIRPDNWVLSLHKYFKTIFTFDDRYIDDKKYFKLNYPCIIQKPLKIDKLQRRKLCTMIVSNKTACHPSELYSERIKAIRWFEINHPESFDLYGRDWNTKSYRGWVLNKREVYQQYKFAICFENASFPGYITEKIFDCFFAGCIPVYLGAPNITEHIPKSTFIDMRRFEGYGDPYNYLVNIPESEYQNYLDTIEQYVSSDQIYEFSIEHFVNTIVQNVII